jgi:hypothetical protein
VARDCPLSPPSPFTFRPRHPGGSLGRFVEVSGFARGTVPFARERIAPTGSSVSVVVLGAPIRQTPDDGRGEPLEARRGWLAGPHDPPVVKEPLGVTHAVGVVCTPIGSGCAGAQG